MLKTEQTKRILGNFSELLRQKLSLVNAEDILGQYNDKLTNCKSVTIQDFHGIEGMDGDCFAVDARLAGTDLKGSIVKVLKVDADQLCQEECFKEPECNYFLYFNMDHPQWYKHRVCRLLKQPGALQLDQKGHVSGPKICGPPREEILESILKTLSPLVDKVVCDGSNY